MPPSKKSSERVEILLECLANHMPVKRACEFAQIDKQTFYNWYKEDTAFRLKADYAKSKSIRELIARTAEKDPWKILKNLDSENFKDEVHNIEENPLDKLSESELFDMVIKIIEKKQLESTEEVPHGTTYQN